MKSRTAGRREYSFRGFIGEEVEMIKKKMMMMMMLLPACFDNRVFGYLVTRVHPILFRFIKRATPTGISGLELEIERVKCTNMSIVS